MITAEFLPIRKMQIEDWQNLKSGITITGIPDAEIPFENMLSLKILDYLLNKQLKIDNYTFLINEFHFVAIASLANSRGVPKLNELKTYDSYGSQILDLQINLDADRFQNANRQESLQMIAQLMLDSIPNYLFNRTDFDGEKFYADILPILKPIADGTRTFQDEEFPL